jgi:hypothetical protein
VCAVIDRFWRDPFLLYVRTGVTTSKVRTPSPADMLHSRGSRTY